LFYLGIVSYIEHDVVAVILEKLSFGPEYRVFTACTLVVVVNKKDLHG
jgi:hypothetical protein